MKVRELIECLEEIDVDQEAEVLIDDGDEEWSPKKVGAYISRDGINLVYIS